MAGSEAKQTETMKNKRKRNQNFAEGTTIKSSKKHRLGEPQRVKEVESENSEQILPIHDFDEGFAWKNLELVLSIENKDLDINKKVELVFGFVSSKTKEDSGNGNGEDYETVRMSRVVIFLNDWVQSLLVSSKKRIGVEEKPNIQANGTYLDIRCWEIFKFCLEESVRLRASLSFSKNILESIRLIAEHTLSELKSMSSSDIELYFTREEFVLNRTVLDCVGLVFSSHGGLTNESLGLWISTVNAVVELVHKVHAERFDNGNLGLYVMQLSCSILEPFAKFLRANPTHKKNGFHEFVYKLLEPLLHLMGILHDNVDKGFLDWKLKLSNLVEDVLSYGLFHPIQIDGFFGLNSTEKYMIQDGENGKDSKTIIKSYHRHLFAKLEEIVAAKKELASCSIGKLICLLAARVKSLKGALVVSENTKMTWKTESVKRSEAVISGQLASEKSSPSTSLTAEKRKSLFDVFVLIMEPLMVETDGYLKLKNGVRLELSDVHCTLKSINSLLASFMHEKIYLRTEDTSDGACINFLRKVYDSIISLSSSLIASSSMFNVHNKKEIELLASSAKEIVISVGYLIEIDYQVIGSDLTSLWLLVLSFLALNPPLTKEADKFSLHFKIAEIGSQLFYLYSQLRQVSNAVFALCKAIRLLISHDGDGEVTRTKFLAPLLDEAHARLVGMLLCSEGFKISIQKAVKSTPEGQVSSCIQQLVTDISESLKWVNTRDVVSDKKGCGSLNLGNRIDLQAELLGRGLSEVYALVLKSLTVTTGNSYLVGKSLKGLITVLSPSMSNLVGVHADVVNKFLFSVMKNRSNDEPEGDEKDSQSFRFSTHWVFVFFFQLYMSCKALYRQASSLMPPDSSKKMSAAMGDSFLTLSGQDWMQMADWKNGGYFSCVDQSSASLDVVVQAVSNVYVRASDVDCSPLIYVMNAMALQRVVDLNRQIKSLEYLLQNNECLVQIRLLDDEDLSRYHKKGKKLKKQILILRQEAGDLTNFMMDYLSVVSKNQRPISTLDVAECEGISANESDGWDFSVSSVDKKSLPTAIWWILCQNIDVWSIHAAKRKLKTFLSLLIRASIPFGKSSLGQVEKHKTYETNQLNRVTIWEISLELFNNSILYEQRFVCRYLASRFCLALEESASTFTSSSSKNVDLMSSPNWEEVLSDLDKSLPTISSSKKTVDNCLTTCASEPMASLLTSVKLTAPQSLLNLLSWIPKGFFDSKSFLLLLTSILNLERLVIGSLLEDQSTLSSHRVYELFRLFMSCRKVLKYIIMASCEENTASSQSVVSLMYSEKSLPVIWLFKSLFLVVGIQSSFSNDSATQVDDMIFSLLDHTLYVFLKLQKYHFDRAAHSITDSENPGKEEQKAVIDNEQTDLVDLDQRLRSCSYAKSWKSVSRVAKSLKEQMQSSVVLLQGVICDEKVGVENLNMFSSVIACFSGFLWGLVSVIKQIDVKSADQNIVLSGWKDEPNSEINLCMNVFEELSGLLLGTVFDMDQMGMNGFVDKSNGDTADISCHKDQDNSGAFSVRSKKFKSIGSKSVASFLTGVDSLEDLPLNKPLLRNLLKGDCPKAAFLLRELFMASSGILGLKLHTNCTPLSARLLQAFTGTSQALLSEFVDLVDSPQSSSFVWLDGVVKYLEELGNHFPMTDPTLSGDLYVKIVELLLRAIGKCIALEGKKATLASHETESSTKLLHGDSGLYEVCEPCKPHGLDEIKSRLRISFTVFIKKSSEFHLLSAIKAIERALVGVRERSAMIYDIKTGSENGGKVSSVVAAGIDCVDLVLESVSGRKRLNVVKRHIRSLIASAFNVILHLQSPLIFYKRSIGDSDPDSGAVILMCVEVLKRISGKHALYQMEAWHIAQSLLIPGALFQNFLRLRLSNDRNSDHIDRRFSIDLFAACCRLLYNVLKHHKSELKRCIAVLESSVSILLHCLETMNSDLMVRNGYFSWEVEEGVQCAYCLRRIYEEIRHQKEILGRHCSQFLSNYVWVYSGYGPLKTGIKREVDEALRPGVYALIDACSPSDLQHLHTVFGEGPCRNTLATLRHDYKLNFQFEGKV